MRTCLSGVAQPSDRVMELAERLYTRGFISYPRTETERFKAGSDLLTFVSEQCASPAWGAYAQSLVDGGFQWPRNGSKDDEAHPPIHPTKFLPPGEGEGDERALYELIARHFLACCSNDAQGHQTSAARPASASLPCPAAHASSHAAAADPHCSRDH